MVRRTKSIEAVIKEANAFLNGTKLNKRIRKDKAVVKNAQVKEKVVKKPKVNKDPVRIQVADKGRVADASYSKKKNPGEQKKEIVQIQQALKQQPPQQPPQQVIKQAVPKAQPIKKMEIEKSKAPRATRSNLSNASAGSEKGKPIAGMIDCVFVVDTTGSMDAYLERTTHCVQMLVERIKAQTKGIDVSVRFGFVAYRDHPPQELTYITQSKDLCKDKEILQYIQEQDCYGGGDGAEAALDGLNIAATEISWRDSGKIPSLRYIFHICDQPPHGKQFGGYSELWDEGCPCGLTPDLIIHRINVRQIHYRLIKASYRLEAFGEYFKSKIVNYDDHQLDDGVAEGMEIRVTDMVIRELLPDVLYE